MLFQIETNPGRSSTDSDYCETMSLHIRFRLNVFVEGLDVKRREGREVKYAVGLVMHHHLYNYSCVIIGWDPVCVASEEWILQMNVESLSRQHLQPFYNVLVEDGTNRYAAEGEFSFYLYVLSIIKNRNPDSV